MKTADLVKDIIGSGLTIGGWRSIVESFLPTVLKCWLEKYQWVEDSSSPCMRCKELEKRWDCKFSEEICNQNVKENGSCYRETLKYVFIPFVRKALAGEAPSIRELGKVVHKKGPIHDGIGEKKLYGLICHELGGMVMTLQSEGRLREDILTQADHDYLAEILTFVKERFPKEGYGYAIYSDDNCTPSRLSDPKVQ